MTDITTWQPAQTTQATAIDNQTRAVANLRDWATSADAAYTVAERLVQSSFVPAQFKGKPIEACSAILAGLEVGLSPMSALRAFDIIQGVAAPRARTLRAIVQSYGHEIELIESTATRCIMRGRRRGAQDWQKVTWTIDRAKELQLLGKDNWKKQPQAMLVARATSEIANLIAADAILGSGYTAEEVADGSSPEAEPVEAAPSVAPAEGERRMSRATHRAQRQQPTSPKHTPADDAADGEVVDAEVVEEQPADTGEQISPAQQRALFAAFRDAGFTSDARSDEGRAARLAYLSSVVGQDVESTSELTRDQASRCIDALRADATDLANTAEAGGFSGGIR